MGHQLYYRASGKLNIAKVLSQVKDPEKGEDQYSEIEGHKAKVSSLRVRTFLNFGVRCAWCGFNGDYFILERDKAAEKNDGSYHLNLYGDYQGTEVMLTYDHIVPRAKGGKNQIGNTRTMCQVCNWIKANGEEIEPYMSVLDTPFSGWRFTKCRTMRDVLNLCKTDTSLRAILITEAAGCPVGVDVRRWLYHFCEFTDDYQAEQVKGVSVPNKVKKLWEAIVLYSDSVEARANEGNSGEFSDHLEAERLNNQLFFREAKLCNEFEKMTGFRPVKQVGPMNTTWTFTKKGR